MLAAMLPVSAIAESYSAAIDLRILNKAHQEVEKDLLAVDSEQYKAGKAPEETVAELIGMLESDPRIASVKRDSATTFTYKLHSGLTAVYDYNIIHGRPQGKLPEPSSLEQMLPMKHPGAAFQFTLKFSRKKCCQAHQFAAFSASSSSFLFLK